MNPVLASVLISVAIFVGVNGHGRLLEPPNRSSLWRFPEFEEYNPPTNYNDNELFCGGAPNGGRCGECGDSWELPKPRPNENGGLYGNGVIVRHYNAGQTFPVEVELTASHSGYFEFRLCEHNNLFEPESDSCFERHLLELADGSGTQYPIFDGLGMYVLRLRLPQNVKCSQCILQWHYRVGNSWGVCPNGTEGIGCGPQETFRGCSDIAIE